jgi:hypothetical protein
MSNEKGKMQAAKQQPTIDNTNVYRVEHSTSWSTTPDYVRALSPADAIEQVKQQILSNKGIGSRFVGAEWFKKAMERKVAETDWANAKVTLASPKAEMEFRAREVINALQAAIERAETDPDYVNDIPVLEGYIQKIYDNMNKKVIYGKFMAWVDGLDRTAQSY